MRCLSPSVGIRPKLRISSALRWQYLSLTPITPITPITPTTTRCHPDVTGRFKALNTNGLCRLDEAADRYLVDLKPLMDAVVGDLSSFSSPHRAVVFDDVISLLSACRADPLTACRAVAGLSPESVACRILVLHEDVDDFSSVVKALSHEAATVVSLKSLASGSSAEIEARVEVLRRKVGGGVSGADLGVVEGAVSR